MAKKTDEEIKETTETAETTAAQAKDPGMELVDAFYPDMPGTDYHGDITVGLNGVMYKIKRGVAVKLPLAVKEIIDRSIAEDARVAEMIERIKEMGKSPIANL